MSPVKEADPSAQDLSAAFAEAMGAAPKPREPSAPAEIDPDAPHGRDDEGNPLAPFGYTQDGRPRRSNAGRKSKDDKARTGPAASPEPKAGPGKGSTAKPEPHNYVPALTENLDAAWMVLSVTGKIAPEIPLISRFLPAQKIAAQATILRSHQPGLTGAIQYAAQHNATAAKWAARLEKGEITWTLMFGFMIMPFFVQSAAVWKGDKAVAAAEMGSLAELAAKNDQDLNEFLENMARQFGAASSQAEGVAELVTAGGIAEESTNGHQPMP